MGRLFVLFTVVPLLELYLLVRLGEVMGAGATILLVLATGIGGAALARNQGSRVLREWQEAMNTGRMPAEGVLGGVLVLVGGVLLVTPGVMTDFVGMSLLFPVTRRMWATLAKRWLEARVAAGQMRVVEMHGSSFDPFDPRGAAPGVERPDAPASAGPRRPSADHERPPPGVIEIEGEEVPPSRPERPKLD